MNREALASTFNLKAVKVTQEFTSFGYVWFKHSSS